MDPTDASAATQIHGQRTPATGRESSSSSSFVANELERTQVPLINNDDDNDPPPLPPTPPGYSPSGATPAYSPSPHADERRLAITTRGGRGPAARTAVFRVAHKRAGLALVLHNQDEGEVRIPSFGRHALVAGTLALASGEDVVRVEVELEGHLKLTIAEGGKKTRQLFKAEHTIWRAGGGAQECPRTLNFIVPMPSAYTDSTGVSRALPPSYQILFPGVPGLFADSVYTLTVRVRRARTLLRVWRRCDSLSTPIKYYPRTRAPRVIMKHTLSFFALLKIAPEEFCQVASTMQTRLGSGFTPIHCLLFIPSSCIYAMTDEIPFHLQLVAPLTSLVALCAPHALALSGGSRTSAIAQLQSSLHVASGIPLTSSLLRPSATLPGNGAQGDPAGADGGSGGGTTASILSGSTLSASLMHNLTTLSSTARGLIPGGGSAKRRPTIRVFILRQITVEVRGQKAWRTCVLGEGVLEPCPPGLEHRHACHYPYPYPRPPPLSPRRRDSSSSTVDANHNTCTCTSAPTSTSASASASAADPLEALNWTGRVRVASPAGMQVGGFAAAGALVVKDFLVLSVVPPEPARSPLVEHQHAQPIRLVTDPLEEDAGEGELDPGA